MSEKRFEFLLRYIRFNDIRGREERKSSIKLPMCDGYLKVLYNSVNSLIVYPSLLLLMKNCKPFVAVVLLDPFHPVQTC